MSNETPHPSAEPASKDAPTGESCSQDDNECRKPGEAKQEEVRHASREEVDQAKYWQEVYEESKDNSPGWNLGEANPEFAWRLANEKPPLKPGKLLVPGCGYGHDALLFAQHGFDVTALDFAEMAIDRTRKAFAEAGVQGTFLKQDFFSLGRDFDASFDAILEHTCFCAIHPSRRAEYAEIAHRVLKPGGQLMGHFYYHQREGGPPWNVTPEEVREVFEPLFECRTLVVAQNNVERRRGKELWARFYRKD